MCYRPTACLSACTLPRNRRIKRTRDHEQHMAKLAHERLAPEWRGSAPQKNEFRPDPELPSTWYKPRANSQTNSGFDQGHVCPSVDCISTIADNPATFLKRNIMPKAPRSNQQTWADLESTGVTN